MHVTDLFDTNADDELHHESNWQDCPSCGYDNPVTYDACTFCGEAL